MALTVKDELFARASLAGKSNREAAIAAGCPEGSASAAGSRFARKPEIIEFIEQLKRVDQEAVAELANANTTANAGDNAHLKVLKPLADKELNEGGGENAGNRLASLPPPIATEPRQEVASDEDSNGDVQLDSLAYLRQVLNDPQAPMKYKIDAAKELAKYEHAKVAAQGKKEAEQAAADAVAGKRFQPMRPPNPQASMFSELDAPIPTQRPMPKGYMQ